MRLVLRHSSAILTPIVVPVYRYLTPSQGRWLGRDRIGEAGGDNLYSFVNNDLVNHQDLLGLISFGGINYCAMRRQELASKEEICEICFLSWIASRMSEEFDQAKADKIVESAIREFENHGKVLTVRCEKCGNLIEVKRRGQASWEFKCPCGWCNGVLRGI